LRTPKRTPNELKRLRTAPSKDSQIASNTAVLNSFTNTGSNFLGNFNLASNQMISLIPSTATNFSAAIAAATAADSQVNDAGVFFVLDEVHIAFNSRAWAETGAEVLYYLSDHA